MKKGYLLFLVLFISNYSFSKTKPHILDGFWENTSQSFTKNAPLHLGAVAITPVLISTGVDARVHTAFNGTDTYAFLPAVSAGYLAPFVIAGPLYAVGELNNDNESIGGAFAVIQTSIITLTTVSLLKSFTGRNPPDTSSDRSVQRQSRDFDFGFLNRGIYDGWPSGHMATITSIGTALIHYYPQKTWLKYVGVASMAYTLLAVSAEHRGQFHWFSDGVAGGLIGYSIGKTVGSNMRANVLGIEPAVEKETVEILPIIGPERRGLQIVWIQ